MVRSGDVSLAVREAGESGRPPVILIHGYPDTSAVWSLVMDALPGVHAVAYDVRGAGGSTAPSERAAYDLELLADDFAAVCDAVAPGRPVHLVGHDWGGIQAWEFVTSERFAGRIASCTTIAAPALGHAVAAASRPRGAGDAVRSLLAVRHSWYVGVLCMPGGPSLVWRGMLGGDRWRSRLASEGVAVDADFPAPTLVQDALHGANLYRQNIPRRLLAPTPRRRAHAPVQLIVPDGDPFIPEEYYASAEAAAPGLLRRRVPGSHWAQRVHPGLVAGWISEFVEQHEGDGGAG